MHSRRTRDACEAAGLVTCVVASRVALFSKFLGLNAVLVELDELSSGVPSFLKSDHGKLLRIAILCLVTWYMRHGLVITTRDCARGDSIRNFIRELCPGVFYTYGEPMFLLTDRL